MMSETSTIASLNATRLSDGTFTFAAPSTFDSSGTSRNAKVSQIPDAVFDAFEDLMTLDDPESDKSPLKLYEQEHAKFIQEKKENAKKTYEQQLSESQKQLDQLKDEREKKTEANKKIHNGNDQLFMEKNTKQTVWSGIDHMTEKNEHFHADIARMKETMQKASQLDD
ncbi:hypothetical protein BLNAU_7030 [Blattamonas nauphoetae]|uniref:Clathrin light chain n=1 Tax=Blattamonas nauphoetae TaxID=2049346 RepID=A0ABQ9Y324_9EUKA|nr:hypothetical protein BLNAU_7030 [Blattamonas nauphoetae]